MASSGQSANLPVRRTISMKCSSSNVGIRRAAQWRRSSTVSRSDGFVMSSGTIPKTCRSTNSLVALSPRRSERWRCAASYNASRSLGSSVATTERLRLGNRSPTLKESRRPASRISWGRTSKSACGERSTTTASTRSPRSRRARIPDSYAYRNAMGSSNWTISNPRSWMSERTPSSRSSPSGSATRVIGATPGVNSPRMRERQLLMRPLPRQLRMHHPAGLRRSIAIIVGLRRRCG